MYLDKQHPTPVYLQLKELLQNQIEQGVYLCHQQLPSERYLCQRHSLSRMTVRRALQALIIEGLAYTRAGKGTFVSQKSKSCTDSLLGTQQQPNGTKFNGRTPSVDYKQRLITPLLAFDTVSAEQTIREALAVHSVETVAGKLFFEVINNLEQKWHRGEIDLSVHNYGITTIYAQLVAMMNAAAMPNNGPKVLLACAPEDQHEIGLLLLALSLRRRGFLVTYLGQNFYANGLYQVLEKVQPELICISAATDESVKNLMSFVHQYQNKLVTDTPVTRSQLKQKPLLAFGGAIFNQKPELISTTPGYHLGKTVADAVISVQEILTV